MSRYQHDCKVCKYIGSFLEKDVDQFIDYWYHESDDWITFVKRYSDEPSDYGAYQARKNSNEPLPESYKRIHQAYMDWVVYNTEEYNDYE